MTTLPELEASLRQLFLDHEHLADDAVVVRLAADAQTMIQVRRRYQLVVGVAASVAVLIGALGIFGALQLRGGERDEAPARPAALPTGPLGDALRMFEAAWLATEPPRLTPLSRIQPALIGTTTVEDKMSLDAGLSATDAAMPASWPKNAVVRWSQGPSATVPVMSPTQTLDAVRRAQPATCTACAPRAVTGARLTTTLMRTATGEAQIPAWEFSLQGTPVTVVMPAIPATHVIEPDPEAFSPLGARVSDDGRELTLEFLGDSSECGLTYSASHARSEHALAVIIEESVPASCEGAFSIGAAREVTIQLDKPLGNATILDARHGKLIPVQR